MKKLSTTTPSEILYKSIQASHLMGRHNSSTKMNQQTIMNIKIA